MNNGALPNIQAMKPYTAPPPGRRSYRGLILDFNERTALPSKRVKTALMEAIQGKLQMYPEYGALEMALARYAGAPQENILITNGSDEAISLIFRTFVGARDTVVVPEPSFSMFTQYAKIAGASVVSPPYDTRTGAYPLDQVLAACDRNPKLIIICNPNNPTGTLVSVSDIKRIATRSPRSVILVDEAYAEFSGVTAVSLIAQNPNIIITRTFSKAFGLAALRIGYILANPVFIAELTKVKGPYDVNLLAAIAATAALSDIPDMRAYTTEVMTQSKPMLEAFFRKNAVPFYPSAANFLLIRVPNAVQIEETLRRNGVLVRRQSKPGIENCLRISIGTVAETKRFIRIFARTICNKSLTLKKIAVFDRDGTLIFEPQDTYQINSVKELRILPGVTQTLRRLTNAGYILVMVTNQDGLGSKGYPRSNFTTVQSELLTRLKKTDVIFRKIYVCPHMPDDNCSCRKPNTSLIDTFLATMNMDRDASFVCGDRASDAGLAVNLGIRYIRTDTNGNLNAAFASFRKENL